MQGYRLRLGLVILALVFQIALTAPSIRTKRQDEQNLGEPADDLNPLELEETDDDGLDREKRKLPDAKFGAKNAIIGFVFSGSKSSAYASADASRPRRYTTVAPGKTTTDDTPDFDRAMVSLAIPDQLFSTSFRTVTNISKMFGNLITNSARRYAQFVRYFKPVLGKTLVVKGYQPTTTTTTVATTTTSESNDI